MKVNCFALRMAKTLWSFGHSKCKRVKQAGSEQEDAVLVDAVPVGAPDKINFGGIRMEVFFEIPQKGR